MVMDLKDTFLQGRINKARDEIAKVLDKHNLLLSSELSYTTGGIVPIIKLVERTTMNEETQAPEVTEEVAQEAETHAYGNQVAEEAVADAEPSVEGDSEVTATSAE